MMITVKPKVTIRVIEKTEQNIISEFEKTLENFKEREAAVDKWVLIQHTRIKMLGFYLVGECSVHINVHSNIIQSSSAFVSGGGGAHNNSRSEEVRLLQPSGLRCQYFLCPGDRNAG